MHLECRSGTGPFRQRVPYILALHGSFVVRSHSLLNQLKWVTGFLAQLTELLPVSHVSGANAVVFLVAHADNSGFRLPFDRSADSVCGRIIVTGHFGGLESLVVLDVWGFVLGPVALHLGVHCPLLGEGHFKVFVQGGSFYLDKVGVALG